MLRHSFVIRHSDFVIIRTIRDIRLIRGCTRLHIGAPMTARIRNFEQGIQLCWWILLAVVIAVVVFIRIHFLAMPLERDEGEYAYAGQLMLQGIPPYRLAYNMKFPGVYAAYALIMWIFGESSIGIHLGLLIVNIANIVIVFLIARRLTGLIAGIAAAASYTILSASPSVLGLAAHATHFVMLPTLLGALVLLKPVLTKKMVFVSGILFGAGLLMKQPAIFFICFGATYLLFRDWRARLTFRQTLLRNSLFITASVLPLAVTAFWLWRAGVLAKFWFWTVLYARQYAGVIPISQAPRIFFEQIGHVIGFGWPLWALAALGVAASFLDKAMRNAAFFILPFIAFSGLALSSGFLFREHYFIFVLPAICLLVGVAMASASNFCSRLARPLQLPSPCYLCGVLEGGAVRTGASSVATSVRCGSNDLWSQSFFGSCSSCRILTRAYQSYGHHRDSRFGTGNLLLCASAFRDWLHLYLWIDGAPEVCRANAT